MQLTHFKLCPNSRAIRLVLGEFGFVFETVDEVPWTKRQSFFALNPAGSLPVLELRTGMTLFGMHSIAGYIGDLQDGRHDLLSALSARLADGVSPGRGLTLFPGDTDDRAEVRRLISWFSDKCDRETTQPLVQEKVRAIIDPSAAAPPKADLLRMARANLKYHLEYVGFLADQRTWLAGEQLSFADLIAAGHISLIDYLGEIEWTRYPAAQDWYQRIKSRPGFRPLLSDRIAGVAAAKHYSELDF